MFDANMRHIPKNTIFFAKAHYLSQELSDLGLTKNDLVLTTMLDDTDENPRVSMEIGKDKHVIISSDTDFYDNLFVYEGKIDGTDFIDEVSRHRALKIMKERPKNDGKHKLYTCR